MIVTVIVREDHTVPSTNHYLIGGSYRRDNNSIVMGFVLDCFVKFKAETMTF
jgi:hypothetical protein